MLSFNLKQTSNIKPEHKEMIMNGIIKKTNEFKSDKLCIIINDVYHEYQEYENNDNNDFIFSIQNNIKKQENKNFFEIINIKSFFLTFFKWLYI